MAWDILGLDPPCSQRCTNTIGSFRCDCFSGYYLATDKENRRRRRSRQCLVAGPESPQLYLASDGEGLRGYDLNKGTLYPVWLDKEQDQEANNTVSSKKRYRAISRLDNGLYFLVEDPVLNTTTGFKLNLDRVNDDEPE